MEIKVVYEDNDCLVIDKPSGVVVNKAESVKGETVQEWLVNKFSIFNFQFSNKEQDKDFINRAGIVHRIDKETSGLLLVAKNPEAFSKLQQQFKERVVKKKYLALVHGLLKPDQGEINIPIGRLPWNRERFGAIPFGKEAKTTYKVIGYYQNQYSLVEASPFTGRTHQIRVHFKYLNHPLVGDEFYAGRKTAKSDRKWCPRLFLHAAYLKFIQPTSGKEVEVKSELPKELEEVLNNLK